MPDILKKLNFKDQSEILVLNPPLSFEPVLASLQGVTIHRSLAEMQGIYFMLAFVTRQHELDEISAAMANKAPGDAVVWFAYPKGSSKRYKAEFNRDTGWHVLGEAGFEPVRLVAIDEDWSALRFRRVAFIKDMKRRSSMALSDVGKSRTKL